MAKNRRITARCDDKLYSKIQDEADKADMKFPEYVRHICQYYRMLKNNELPLKLEQIEADKASLETEKQTALDQKEKFREDNDNLRNENDSYQEEIESIKTQRDTFKRKFEEAGEAITKLESILFECDDQGFFRRLLGVKPQGLQTFLQEKLKSQIQ